MGLRPTQGDENRVEEGWVGNYTYLCHLDRSEAQWRDLRFPTSGAKARQIWGTLDWWRFWIRTSSRFRVPQVPTLGPGIPQIAEKTQVSFANLGHPVTIHIQGPWLHT